MFLEVAGCRAVVLGAEVGADTIGRFRIAMAQRRGRRVGVVVGAGGALEAFVFCVQVVLGKLWVLLHKAPELVCEKTTGGRQRCKKTTVNKLEQTKVKEKEFMRETE